MVVLTLHRDEPLSTDEIRLLPPGCYPVLGAGDTIARANLALPVAHIARYAAELARTIPDADFVAEERPTIRGAALLEAGVLDEPYWAYTPPLAFRSEPPGAAALAEGPGTVDAQSPLVTSDEPPEPKQTLPDTPEPIDFASLVAGIQKHQSPPAIGATPALQPPAVDSQKLDVSALLSARAPTPAPTPAPAAEKPAARVSQVPSQIMDMFRSIRAQEDYEGVPVLKIDAPPPAAAPAAPLPLPIGVEHTVRRNMSLADLVDRMRAQAPAETAPAPGAAPAAMPDVGVPQIEAPGPGSSDSAPEISAFWELVKAGDVEGAEGLVRAEGLASADHANVASLFASEEADLIALGLRASRLSPWPGAVRLSRRLLYHPASAVRIELARTLAALSGLDAEPDLVVLGRDPDRAVSNAANTALRRLKKRSRF